MTNPFSLGENRTLRPPSTALVIIGGTGDLTHRKLIPALYDLASDGLLPERFKVIGCARTELSDEAYRKELYDSLKIYSRRPVSPADWKDFAKSISYHELDATEVEDFKKLKKRLESVCKEGDEDYNYLYYLATSPRFFGPVAANFKAAGLVEDPYKGFRTTSLVVEKPFGRDFDSAQALNRELRASFDEKQIYRIDHYLGKETVQNILVFRFANGIFEPLWNRQHIDHIQLALCEDIGVGNRAGYFDKNGILRDIVQNHLLQMLALLCIEPPFSLSDANSIRDEKVKVLQSIKRLKPHQVKEHVVRGQYQAGHIHGKKVKGYLQEEGVDSQSLSDTFVALRLEIDNWRWAGVPFYIRTGKRLPKRIAEITIYFKKPPGSLFKGRQVGELDYNVLAIQVQPDESISLKIASKAPGPRMRVRPAVLDFSYGDVFGVPSPDAYERLLLDAMKGDSTLFTRDDEIEEAWDIVMPILDCWQNDPEQALYQYAAGTWGPSEASSILHPDGHIWRRL